ncbi:MAG TPA: metal-dependent hydrolase [Thermohalobaculum sp.]|nr:metal-dependent hydrolase [Thermohalobaculum sp.]
MGQRSGVLAALALVASTFVSGAQYAQAVEVQWLGHATTRIVTDSGKVIIIDPYLTINPKTPPEYRDLAALGPVDLILVTHGHGDHSADLLPLAKLTGAKVIAPYEMINNLLAMGGLDGDKVLSLGKGGYVQPFGREVKVHMVPAEHSSSVDLKALGYMDWLTNPLRHVAGGEAAGFVIEFESGFTLYHTGDTGVFGDMALIREMFAPDLVLACIGGTFTMGPEGAAYAIDKLLKPKQVIPIHYGTYPVVNRTPEEFIEALGDSPVEVLVLQPGEVRKF